MQIKTLCVFCGSSFGNDEIYRKKANELGRYLAEKKIRLVYGGGYVGLMGELASSVIESGGEVTGVIPELIHGKVKSIPLTETIITADMHERKQKMYDISDAFTAMPGGIGTLEEISEVFTWQQLGYHEKPVSLYNINNFYEDFISFLDKSVKSGFIRDVHRERLIIENSPQVLISQLENFEGKTIDKWSK